MAVLFVSLNFDGNRVATGHRNGTVCYWNVDTSELLGTHIATNEQACFAIAINLVSSIVACSGKDSVIRFLSTETGEVICLLQGHRYSKQTIQFNHD